MKRLLLSVFVLCLASGPVFAQDTAPGTKTEQGEKDDPALIRDKRTQYDCDNIKGAPAGIPCLPELKASRERLQQVYRQAYVVLPEDQQDAFEQDQLNWISSRDSKCSYAELQKGPGTYLECANAHNGWRAQELLGEKPDYPTASGKKE